MNACQIALSELADRVARGDLSFAEAIACWTAACSDVPSSREAVVREAVIHARGRSLAEALTAAALAVAADQEAWTSVAVADGRLAELADLLLPTGVNRKLREELARLVEVPGSAPPSLRLSLWEQLSVRALEAGDAEMARSYAASGCALATAWGRLRAAAICQMQEGNAWMALEDPEAAVLRYGEAVRLAEEAGWPEGQWRAASALALALGEEGTPDAEYWCREALRLAGTLGAHRDGLTIDCLRTLGALLQQRGECEEAAGLLKEALERSRTARDRRRVLRALLPLGRAYYRGGAHQEAIDVFWEALSLAEELDDEDLRWEATSGLADVRARTEALPSTRYPRLAMFREMLNDPLTVSIFDRGLLYPGANADLTRREVRERVARRTLCWLRAEYDKIPYEEYDLSSDEAEILLARALHAIKNAIRDRAEKRNEMLQRFRLHLDREGKLSLEHLRQAARSGSREERRLWDLVYPALHERTIERAILFWLIDHGVRLYPDKTRGMLS